MSETFFFENAYLSKYYKHICIHERTHLASLSDSSVYIVALSLCTALRLQYPESSLNFLAQIKVTKRQLNSRERSFLFRFTSLLPSSCPPIYSRCTVLKRNETAGNRISALAGRSLLFNPEKFQRAFGSPARIRAHWLVLIFSQIKTEASSSFSRSHIIPPIASLLICNYIDTYIYRVYHIRYIILSLNNWIDEVKIITK